jgi:P27 family predicted phage terminase small subunit
VPRTKKPAGQAVDRRNGRRAELAAAAPLAKFPLPRRVPAWLPETRKAWDALWEDPVSSLLSVADRPLLLRWVDALDRAGRTLAEADKRPTVKGSMGQPVENPLYGVADKALRVAMAIEAQVGVGALNRARLGLTFSAAQLSLADLNAAFMGEGDDEPDPRLG